MWIERVHLERSPRERARARLLEDYVDAGWSGVINHSSQALEYAATRPESIHSARLPGNADCVV